MLLKKHETINGYQTQSPLKNHKSSVCKHMELSTAKWTSRTSLLGKYRSFPLICLKYNISSLKTHSNNVNYHRLAKSPKFSITKMQCTYDNLDDFSWVVR